MHIKVNDIQAIEARITRPLTGPWSAEFSLDTDLSIDLASAAIISIADYMQFVGTVTRSGTNDGRCDIRVVGGAGQFNFAIGGKSYRKPKFGTILKDLLTECGEYISTTIADEVMDYAFRHWCRASNPARRELGILLATRGLNWRVLPNGNTWVGFDDWPAGIIPEYLIEENDSKAGRVVIAADTPTISPGEVFVDRFVQTVVHMLDKDKFRTELVFLD